jgi:hypothetical protein
VDPFNPSDPLNRVPFLAQGGIPTGSSTGGTLTPDEARAATSSYIQNQVLPYSIQWNFGIQHVFKNDYTFEARYLGTRGVHLLVQNRLNSIIRATESQHLPTYFQAPSQSELDSLPLTLDNLTALSNNRWEQYGFAQNVVSWPPIGNSTYHGMALQINRRFSKGFSLIGAYTWSHNIDDSTATFFATVLTTRRQQDFPKSEVIRQPGHGSPAALYGQRRLGTSLVLKGFKLVQEKPVGQPLLCWVLHRRVSRICDRGEQYRCKSEW